MKNLAQLCQQLGIPLWVVPLINQAATMKCDPRRRYKAYKLIRRQLWDGGVGLEKTKYPTYIYPQELKDLLRTVFPEGVRNYPDPDHNKVVHVTLEDLHLIGKSEEKEQLLHKASITAGMARSADFSQATKC